ncbi:hypothetical protein ABKN59_009927 [Abortiporus biennis]
MATARAIYDVEPLRSKAVNLNDVFGRIFIHTKLSATCKGNDTEISPDRVSLVLLPLFKNLSAASGFVEEKNEIGEGGCDPSYQGEGDYISYYSSSQFDKVRQVSCCPAFVIGFAGPNMCISGVVYADRVISQRLTDYIHLGESGYQTRQVRIVARIIKALKQGLDELDTYYEKLSPAMNTPAPSIKQKVSKATKVSPLPSRSRPAAIPASIRSVSFPHFRYFQLPTGKNGTLRYNGLIGNPTLCIVKFTNSYSKDAHNCLAEASLASKVWHCSREQSCGNFWVIVMDYIKGETALAHEKLSEATKTDVKRALRILRKNRFVFGDLRRQNVMVCEDKSVRFVDFDWAGKVGEVRYPPDINPDIQWPVSVAPDEPILFQHDLDLYKEFVKDLDY